MAEAGDDVAIISVKFTSSDKAAGQVPMTLASTIGSLKEAIRSNFKVEPKRLIFQGRILNKDSQTLEECKLKDGLTVVVQVAPAAAPTPPPPPPPSGGGPPLASPAPSASPAPPANASATARQAAAQAFGRGPGGGSAMGAASPVALAVATVRAQPAGVARDCLMTLTKVIDNIVAHPNEDKYRKIKRTNAGFLRKVGGVPGGEACMRGLGFVEADADQGSWLLAPSAAAWNILTSGRVQIQSALATLPSSAFGGGVETGPSPPAGFAVGLGERPSPGAFPGGFGGGFAGGYGGGGMGMGGGMGGGVPDMATMARMVQDPAIMQGMMNDPSVQGMMRNNPQMAAAMQSAMANPERMSQAMNLMETNPAMAQMAQQMMQDPAALQRASQMDLGGALAAGINAGANPAQGFPPPVAGVGGQGGFVMPPSPAPAPAPTTDAAIAPVHPSPATDSPAAMPAAGGIAEAAQVEEEMTEDELVAEAIRRSMEDI